MTKKPARISTFGSRATSVVSVSLTLLILGILAITLVGAHRLTDNVRRSMHITVQAVPGADELALARIKQLISKNPAAESYTYTSAEQVLNQEVQYIDPELTAILDENPYSAEFDVSLRPAYATGKAIKKFTAQMKASPDVDNIISDSTVVDNVNRSVRKVVLVLGIVGAILLAISLVLIIATVSLSIYSRRFLIRTMKLVGATPGFIRRPFIRAGLLNGLIAGLISSALLAGGVAYAIEAGPWLAPVLDWNDLPLVCAGMVALGCLLCPLAAWIAATRYLRRNYDSLYRK